MLLYVSEYYHHTLVTTKATRNVLTTYLPQLLIIPPHTTSLFHLILQSTLAAVCSDDVKTHSFGSTQTATHLLTYLNCWLYLPIYYHYFTWSCNWHFKDKVTGIWYGCRTEHMRLVSYVCLDCRWAELFTDNWLTLDYGNRCSRCRVSWPERLSTTYVTALISLSFSMFYVERLRPVDEGGWKLYSRISTIVLVVVVLCQVSTVTWENNGWYERSGMC